MKKMLKYAVIIICFFYIAFCAAVFIYPKPFFYHPQNSPSDIKHAHMYDYPAQEVRYKSSDGTPLYAWATPARTKNKMIVYLHGNSDNIEEFYYKLKSFVYDGYGTFIPEYRGFGGIKGRINQENLENDAIAAVKFLNKHGYKNSDIYLYGMSLGSHMAVHTAYQLQKEEVFAGIILEVPFDSMLQVVQKRFPFFPNRMIVRDKYDNSSEIRELKSPILVMGASQDQIVPVELAKNLYEISPNPKKIIIYENAQHHNLFNFRNDLDVMNWIETNEKNI